MVAELAEGSVADRAFADTSGLLALAHTKDQYHREAAATARRFLGSGGRFLSTPLVLAELHGLLLYRRGPDVARRVVTALRSDTGYEWVAVDPNLVDAAVSGWLERFVDQTFTLCDAVSFEVMRRGKLKAAFAYDQHFETAGFDRLGGTGR
jgi:predicted nucleic acid-binding protein